MMLTRAKAKRIADKAAQRVNQALPYRPSFPMDTFLTLEHPQLDLLVDSIAKRVTATSKRQRKRTPDAERKFLYAIKVILLNLILTEKLPKKTLLAVQKGAGDYSHRNRYACLSLAYKPFIAAYDGLKQLKLLQETKGYWDARKGKGKVTRVEPSNTLRKSLEKIFPQDIVFFSHAAKETIVLKDAEGKLKDYRDTEFTRKARRSLDIINKCLSRHWYDLELNEEGFNKLYTLLQHRNNKESQKPSTVNFLARNLYRVFNNGKFTEGGRFYGGWWEGIPSEYRKYITINQKLTVEIDYSGFHPRMLYALKGLDMGERDPYLIEGVLGNRDLGKVTFTKLLNGKRQLRKPEGFDDACTGLSWKEALAAMEEYHSPIREFFRTGYGLKLQRIDSDIAEKILLHFAGRDTPCLPVHDSFLIHHDLEDELRDMMEREYKKVFSLNAKTKMDNYFEVVMGEIGEQGEVKTSINEILRDTIASQHERRWMAWLNHVASTKGSKFKADS